MKRGTSRLLQLMAVTLATWSCPSDRSLFWESGRTYEFALQVTEQIRVLPERRPSVGEATDTTTMLLHVDSLVRDTLYGTYEADFLRLGLMMEPVTSGARHARGFVGNDSLRLELMPEATDAGLWLIGALREGQFRGEWYPEVGSGRGTFSVRRHPR